MTSSGSAEAFDPRFGMIACGVALLALLAAQWMGLTGPGAVAACALLAMGVLGFGVAAHAREKRARFDAQARARELESAGAKLAHDLNNALYAVRGSVEILALRAGRDPDVMKFSDMARRNTDRCAGLVELFVERLSIASQPVEPGGQDARPLLADPVQTNAAMLELTAKPAQDPKVGP